MTDRENIFKNIYSNGIWNDNNVNIPLSGPGSTLENTALFRLFFDNFCIENNIKSIVDIGCGDLTWMTTTNAFKLLNYTGIDIVESLIISHKKKYSNHTFIQMDVVKNQPPSADLVIIRDVLFHLTHSEINDLFKNIKGLYKYIILTSCNNIKNIDTLNQYHFHEVNLNIEPFNFKIPALKLCEEKFNRNVYFYRFDELPFI